MGMPNHCICSNSLLEAGGVAGDPVRQSSQLRGCHFLAVTSGVTGMVGTAIQKGLSWRMKWTALGRIGYEQQIDRRFYNEKRGKAKVDASRGCS